MNQPWMKFYPADWRSDPKLRLCSLAARGLWMEMLALMHEAEPYGHLTVGGRAMTARELANLVGIATKSCSKLLDELEINGVFSRDESGIVYSRRMVRDAEKAQKHRENGAKGGNPKLIQGVNPEDKAQKPEARSQKPDKNISHPSDAQVAEATGRGGYTDEFERFWQAYPTRTPNPKKPAFAAWVAAKRHGADPETMIRGAQGYARWTRQRANEDANWGDHLIAQAQTFLRQARWEEFADARAGPDAGRPRTMEEIRRARSQAWN